MANKKEIIRNQYITIKVSKEEKELWLKYSESMKIAPTKLARNILMMEAKSLVGKLIYKPVIDAYIKYCEITKNKEALKNFTRKED